MANARCKVVRFHDDLEGSHFRRYKTGNMEKPNSDIHVTQVSSLSCPKTNKSRSLKSKVLSRVFSEDYERVDKRILDLRGTYIRQWNRIFFVACLVSLFVDRLFFLLPNVNHQACVEIDSPLNASVTVLRSITDLFYLYHIYLQFQTAFVAPSSQVFRRGELVIDPSRIALR